jgi:TPR repeat protein
MGVLRNLFGNSKDLEAVRLFNLGAAHARGDRGMVRNDYEAARLYKLAADRGLAEAQYSLGTFYESSRGGLLQDDGEAAHYYQLASYRRFAPEAL